MSSCIKELFDYDLVKKCSKCGNISLKIIFHKDKATKNGLNPIYESCRNRKQNEYDSRNRENKTVFLINNHDEIKILWQYFPRNKEKINSRNESMQNSMKTDYNVR